MLIWVYAYLLAAIPALVLVRLFQMLTAPAGELSGFLKDLVSMLREQYKLDQDKRLLAEKWAFMLGAILLWPRADHRRPRQLPQFLCDSVARKR